jgi:hypothetical protein
MVLVVLKFHHYIFLCTTKVVENSNHMHYLLNQCQINGKFSSWIVIFQEFDLEFTTPKSKKPLVLAEFNSDFPSDTKGTLVNTNFLDEHMFIISSDDPWYHDVFIYLHSQKFGPHLSRDDHWHIRHQAPHYLLIEYVLYRQGVDTILCHCLTLIEAKHILNDFHSDA